jgi:hypothetical protein
MQGVPGFGAGYFVLFPVLLAADIAFAILERNSLKPRLWAPRHAILIDIVLAGLVMALVGSVAPTVLYTLSNNLHPEPWKNFPAFAAAGFAGGCIVRALRWSVARWRVAPSVGGTAWRVAAIVAATLAAECGFEWLSGGITPLQACAYLSFLCFAPVLAWLDGLVDERNAIGAQARWRRLSLPWLLPVAAGVALSAAAACVWAHESARSTLSSASSPPPRLVIGPDNATATQSAMLASLTVKTAGSYEIYEDSNAHTDAVILVYTKNNMLVAKDYQPIDTSIDLKAGDYWLCSTTSDSVEWLQVKDIVGSESGPGPTGAGTDANAAAADANAAMAASNAAAAAAADAAAAAASNTAPSPAGDPSGSYGAVTPTPLGGRFRCTGGQSTGDPGLAHDPVRRTVADLFSLSTDWPPAPATPPIVNIQYKGPPASAAAP